MADFLLLMHDDTTRPVIEADWPLWFAGLRQKNAFEGGSALGGGDSVRRTGDPGAISAHLTGFVRVTAVDLAEARTLVVGNPVYEAGGTVEVRELPRT